MNCGEKVNLILEYICKYMPLDKETSLVVRSGIVDGLLKIQSIEQAERAAREDTIDVPVDRVQEGFAFWNSGGYDKRQERGYAVAAAGLDGEKLRKLRTVAERNGRHSQVIVYPGCYIARARAMGMYVPVISVFQLLRFESRGDAYVAVCQRVWAQRPYFCSLPDDKIIAQLVGVTGDMALASDLYRSDW